MQFVKMEEEVNYSTVVFKNGPPKEKKEEATIYSQVKPKAVAAPAPAAAAPAPPPAAPAPAAAPILSSQADSEAAAHSHSRLLLVCLGILCALLVGSIIAIIYVSVTMTEQKANIRELMEGMRVLENKNVELSRDRDDLNYTLGVILNFSSFPVTEYCPDKKCQPCRSGWIQFQEKCYLVYEDSAPWKTWEASRKYCKNKTADLVVIDDLQEQEFISNHTKYYFDRSHGYWIGLYKKDENWVWIDGRNDTLRFWINETLGIPGSYALTLPGRNPTHTWNPAECVFLNKFICESEALIRSE